MRRLSWIGWHGQVKSAPIRGEIHLGATTLDAPQTWWQGVKFDIACGLASGFTVPDIAYYLLTRKTFRWVFNAARRHEEQQA